jgi:hypothetical protein
LCCLFLFWCNSEVRIWRIPSVVPSLICYCVSSMLDQSTCSKAISEDHILYPKFGLCVPHACTRWWGTEVHLEAYSPTGR